MLIAAPSAPERPSFALDLPASRRNSWIAHPSGAIRLPEKPGVALEDIASACERYHPLLLADELHQSAWAGLLANPSAVVPLSVEGPLDCESFWTAPVDLSMVRRVGLATVFAPPDETLSTMGLSAARAAASAELTLLLSADGTCVERAHLKAEWYDSTLGMLTGLERLQAMAPASAGSAQRRPKLSLLLHPTVSPGMSGIDRARLTALADLLECTIFVIDRLKLDSRTVARHVASSPRMLLSVGPLDPSTSELISRHRAAGHDRLARNVQPTGTRTVVDEVTEALLGLAGFGAALMQIAPPSTARKTRRARPPMPFARASQCRHLGSSRVYVEDPDTQLWWTRDDDRHAESIFKTYTRSGEKLLHEADRHELGEVVQNKHKGPSGEVIDLSACHQCSRPDKHRT